MKSRLSGDRIYPGNHQLQTGAARPRIFEQTRPSFARLDGRGGRPYVILAGSRREILAGWQENMRGQAVGHRGQGCQFFRQGAG